MRLQTIKIHGFKSFADAIEIQLQGDCMGVVGPNGCGKSNIMDALRWVLGESRANELRGEHMQDVLFNGSGQRKAAAKASVELIFSNESGRIQGVWAPFLEISVKRSLDRQNNSQYFINQQQVRRRDIHDLFMGTGLGPKAYAIIGQGMINRIIESKPEEMRLFLEEAAGISKYKERRKESINRLEDAQENCLRLADILQELEQQKSTLDQQAQAARAYKKSYRSLYLNQYTLAELHIGLQKYEWAYYLDIQKNLQTQLATLNQRLLEIEAQTQELSAQNWQEKVQTTRAQLDVLKYQLVNEEAQQNYQQKLKVDWQSSQEKLQEYIDQVSQKIEELTEEQYEQQAQYEYFQENLLELEESKEQFDDIKQNQLAQHLQNVEQQAASAQKATQSVQQEVHHFKQQIQWLFDKKKQIQSRIDAIAPILPTMDAIEHATHIDVFANIANDQYHGNDLIDDQTRAMQQALDAKKESLLKAEQQQIDVMQKIEQETSILKAHQAGFDSLEKTLTEQQDLAQNLIEKLNQRRQQLQILEHEKQTLEKTIKNFKKIEQNLLKEDASATTNLDLIEPLEILNAPSNNQSNQNERDEFEWQNTFKQYINVLLPKMEPAIYAQGFSDAFAELFDQFNDQFKDQFLQQNSASYHLNADLFIQYLIKNVLLFLQKDLTPREPLSLKIKQKIFCIYLAIEQILQNDLIELSFLRESKSDNDRLKYIQAFLDFEKKYPQNDYVFKIQDLLSNHSSTWGEWLLFFCQENLIQIKNQHFKYFVAFYLNFFQFLDEVELSKINHSINHQNVETIYISDDFYITLNINHHPQQHRTLHYLFNHIQQQLQIESLENQSSIQLLLDQLQQQITQLMRKIELLKKEIEQQNTQNTQQHIFLKQLESQVQEKQEQQIQTQNMLQNMQNEMQNLQQNIVFTSESIQQQQEVLQLKIEQIKSQAQLQIQQQQNQQQQNQQLLIHFAQEIEGIELEIEDKSSTLFELEIKLEDTLILSEKWDADLLAQRQKQQNLQEQLQKQQQKEQQIQLQAKNLAQQIQSKNQQLKEYKQQRQQFLEQQQNTDLKIDETQIKALQESIQALQESCQALQTQLTQDEEKFNAQQKELQNLQQARDEGQTQLKNLYEQQHQSELAAQQQQLQIQNHEAQKQAAFEALQEKGFYAELPTHLGEHKPWQTIDFAIDQELIKQSIKNFKKEMEEAKKELNQLGDVNLQAIEAFEQAQKRFTELNDNYQDVQGAIDLLQKTIIDIDQESRQMLQNTFDKSNQLFAELFPELFGGGQAYLATQGDDILTGGIHIIAQPPGKKNSSIHLLSGGEKALTAIALIFAIFKLNPAPFCLLDEVDAPLDDANTERYAKLIKSMSAYTQFLFISHNPIAMEVADYLIGVTMQEKGISRIVEVNINQTIAALKA